MFTESSSLHCQSGFMTTVETEPKPSWYSCIGITRSSFQRQEGWAFLWLYFYVHILINFASDFLLRFRAGLCSAFGTDIDYFGFYELTAGPHRTGCGDQFTISVVVYALDHYLPRVSFPTVRKTIQKGILMTVSHSPGITTPTTGTMLPESDIKLCHHLSCSAFTFHQTSPIPPSNQRNDFTRARWEIRSN